MLLCIVIEIVLLDLVCVVCVSDKFCVLVVVCVWVGGLFCVLVCIISLRFRVLVMIVVVIFVVLDIVFFFDVFLGYY